MNDDWASDRWNRDRVIDRYGSDYKSIAHEEIDRLVKSYVVDGKEELKILVKELQKKVFDLELRAKKKEKEFKEFRKIRKAIKADSINTKMARLVKIV